MELGICENHFCIFLLLVHEQTVLYATKKMHAFENYHQGEHFQQLHLKHLRIYTGKT